jgi:hypothetical protein
VLFHGALDQAPDKRHDWLTRHAADDEMLAHDTANGFLDDPAVLDRADESRSKRFHGCTIPMLRYANGCVAKHERLLQFCIQR